MEISGPLGRNQRRALKNLKVAVVLKNTHPRDTTRTPLSPIVHLVRKTVAERKFVEFCL